MPPQQGGQPVPPPGYAPGQQTQYLPPQPSPAAKPQTAGWVLGLLSVLLVVLGISLDEDGANAWHTVHAWGGLAIAGAVLTLATVAGRSVGLGPQRAFQAAVAGAAALVLYWVLFVLPSVGSNTSLLTTLGVAAGVIAVWVAPGRGAAAGRQSAPQAW
jgi:hypothetical protein